MKELSRARFTQYGNLYVCRVRSCTDDDKEISEFAYVWLRRVSYDLMHNANSENLSLDFIKYNNLSSDNFDYDVLARSRI